MADPRKTAITTKDAIMPEYRDSLPHPYIKAQDFDLAEHGYKGPFVLDEKVDGEWVIFQDGEMYGRRSDWRNLFVNKWDGFPRHFQEDVGRRFRNLWGSIVPQWVVAELAVRGGTSSDVKKCIKQGDPDKRLQLVCHSVPSWSFPPSKVRDMLGNHFETPRPFDPDLGSWIFFNQRELDDIMAACDKRGWEGVVLWPDRPHSWPFRLKVTNTLDVVVTGVEMAGAGKFHGMVGSLECAWSVNGKRVDVGKTGMGWDVPARRALSEADVGRVIEVKARGFASRGKMRHATFVRFREDKGPEECVAPDWWVERYRKVELGTE